MDGLYHNITYMIGPPEDAAAEDARADEALPVTRPQFIGTAQRGVQREAVVRSWHHAQHCLLQQKNAGSYWTGQLSTSALSTATAVSALALVRKQRTSTYLHQPAEIDSAIAVACHWLLSEQNQDGGFGDTGLSHSNIATSLLVLAAWQLADFNETASEAISRAWRYCERIGKWDALRRRYGQDKTFVAPILTNCALAGIVPWDVVPTLPFEAAWLPQSWYRLARMPVVSYAVPALVAIGQAKFHHRPPTGPLYTVRRAAIEPTLRVLQRMQPSSGGYLEAVPLTSFVLMCLADTGRGDHPVACRAVNFLLASRLQDGSLPIDTNLATWATSLSISALLYGDGLDAQSMANADDKTTKASHLSDASASATQVTPTTIRWLLSCQHWSDHPFTGAKPGGWGWSNLSGAVPDADDTPAALLALGRWSLKQVGKWPMLDNQITVAVNQGLKWLLQLQNRDGGWPTFCRGWGKLPFDRSGSDLTAHALRALQAWWQAAERGQIKLDLALESAFPRTVEHGFQFLVKRQNPDGSWFPLWFGNQDRLDEENPVYGTAKVLMAFADYQRTDQAFEQGVAYLVKNQNEDGGWGGGPSVPYRVIDGSDFQYGSSVEETGVALEALLACSGSTGDVKPTIMRALRWMVAAVDKDHLLTSWPIGFYFAKLWYHERLYPIIAATAALGAAVEHAELWLESP